MFVFKVLLALFWNLLIFGGLLFIPAGTLFWWRAWIFLGVVSVSVIAVMITVFRENEELWNERLKPFIQEGQPIADKIIISLFVIAFFCLIAIIPLDLFQFHLLSKPGTLISSLGLLLFIVGWWIISLSFKENTFAAPVVKHQTDRQQIVIDTGVYSLVRHPMYAGAILLMIGMPLWLESYAAVLYSILPILLLIVRVQFEEKFLRQELKGYDVYTERVRYKLLPYLW
ncbi:methyltransferase family protein [Nostoc cycadae]|uniref:Mll0909 protein n=1 Tax=Nostoc cycadae WK-1 TaxID=1861711 RepID=A0A2H6LEJ2_9NOSO|nr:isoprenylcysteine carboxylmethyltransferase family protein [Nostoc cycadae]GBE91641.1 Mll0909 protein [Nostoc cycadae WK-1]